MRLKPAGYTGQLSEYLGGDRALKFMTGAQFYFHIDSRDHENVTVASMSAGSNAGHEKIKQLRESIMNQVDQSSLAAEKGDHQTALARANDASNSYELLRKMSLQDQRSGSSMSQTNQQSASDTQDQVRETQPMTTGVNLFDLAIMVKSNIAAQLRNTDHLEESLEIYTQLCKLVGNASNGLAMGSLISATNSGEVNGSSSSQRSGSKFFLYRFGMNIGNIYFQLGDYQRALKYLRLTLDRFSSAGNQQMRLKLINNIAITLICMSNGGPSGDVISSLSQLLADNIKQQVRASTASARPKSTNQRMLNPSLPTAASFETINSHHFRFLLNIMACLNKRADLQAMVSLLKTHINVGLGQHYSSAITSPSLIRTTNNMSSSRNLDDRLAKLMRDKEAEVRRSLMMSCKLILDLEAKKSHTPVRVGRLGLEFCLRLLASSELYKDLALDLKINCITSLLSQPGKLDVVIKLLEQIDLEQRQRFSQELDQQQQQQPNSSAISDGQKSKGLRSTTMTMMRRAGATASASQPISMANLASNQLVVSTSCKSSNVLSNLSLLYLFRDKLDEGFELAERAWMADKSGSAHWINLATCYYYMNDLARAEHLYKEALALDGKCWVAKYNLILINRKLARHFDELDYSIRVHGSGRSGGPMIDGEGGEENEQMFLAKLMYNGLVLLPVQVSLLYQQSGMTKRAYSILRELTKKKVQAPEIYLHLNKLMIESLKMDTGPAGGGIQPDQGGANTNATTTQLERSISLLGMAIRNHSYHLPLAERLIALYINEFDYKAAEGVLMDCMKNRPDQVRWYQMLAECYRRAADYKEAMRVYRRAIDLFPLDTSCLRAMVKLTAELGLNEENRLNQVKLEHLLKRLGES